MDNRKRKINKFAVGAFLVLAIINTGLWSWVSYSHIVEQGWTVGLADPIFCILVVIGLCLYGVRLHGYSDGGED